MEQRPNANHRGYGMAWRMARKGYLDANPMCVECAEHGQSTIATVVDHIVPHRGNMTLFWDSENWQALCATCHNRKTGGGA